MKLNRRKYLGLTAAAFMAALAGPCLAQTATTPPPPPTVLITNVSIFDGTTETLITGKDLVLSGNTISKLVDTGGDASGYDTVIDGKGGYLTPGLIDAHWHTMLALPYAVVFSSPTQYLDAVATYEAKLVLMRGVTTVRDAGGNTAGLKRATDEGLRRITRCSSGAPDCWPLPIPR